jgi:hypothetical protein
VFLKSRVKHRAPTVRPAAFLADTVTIGAALSLCTASANWYLPDLIGA